MNGSSHTLGRAAVRLGLLLLGAQQLVIGAWALLAPRDFFARVPTVDVIPPYNEHLVRDVGSGLLATVPVIVAALWRQDRALTVLALICVLTFALPHAVFHVLHAQGTFSSVGMILSVALPAALLAVALRCPRPEAAS